MGQQLPQDVVDAERALAKAISDVIKTVPHVGNVHEEPQYPSKKSEAEAIMMVDDPVVQGHKITNYIEIDIPTVSETSDVGGGSDEEYTGLYLTYPISFSLGVVPKWQKAGFPYTSSAKMAMGIYLRARNKFKIDRSLGYDNVTHYYLQLVGQDEATNEKGEALEHLQDWELTVRIVGNF